MHDKGIQTRRRRVLVDIVHPADALFFHHPIRRLLAKGAEVHVASRHKDVTTNVLDRLGIAHTPISSAGTGTMGLGRELICRDARLWKLARRFRPNVMTGFGGTVASHVGALLGIRSVCFYDSEDSRLQIGLTLPFVSEWNVPHCWRGAEARGRTRRFCGYKELSYLDPSRFAPDPAIARNVGWEPGQENFFMRLVEWRASHDRNMPRLNEQTIRAIAENFASKGKLHISSECELPDDLQKYRYRGDVLSIHHLLARCRLYIGESATMAAEAAVLGVPGIFTSEFRLGYIADMERHGMLEKISVFDASMIAGIVDRILGVSAASWRRRRDDMLANKIDVAAYIVERLEETSCQPVS